MIYIIIIYIIGLVLTAIFLKYFGKKIGFDYDQPKTYANYDDWDSNAEAFSAFSIMWPLFIPCLIVFGSICLITNFLEKYFKK